MVMVFQFFGCASMLPTDAKYKPVVDIEASRVKSMSQFNADLAYCKSLASERDGMVKAAVTKGLLMGALGAAAGAAIGAVTKNAGTGAATGASIAGSMGIVAAGAQALTDQKMIIIKCLQNRGYSILSW